MITDRMNSNLQLLFNIEDPIYKSFFCDKDGTVPSTITKPTDIDIGAIASQIEYLRKLSLCLIDQMFIDKAEGEFLTYTLNEFFNSLRLENESDVEWVSRTVAKVFNPKVSRAAIIFSLRPYSSQEPEIINILSESAFADFSFADVYVSDTTILNGDTIIILPAIAESFQSSFFTIKVTIYDTETDKIATVIDLLNNIIAAGITYVLQIIYT